MKYAPILVFVYKRLDHTKAVIEALQKNNEAVHCDLIVHSDGYTSEKDKAGVENVRSYIETIEGFKSVQIISQENNKGLVRSIMDGVTEIVQKYGSVIVLEDDIVVSNEFLKFMNASLDAYEKDENVAQVSGYVYGDKIESEHNAFLSTLTTSWGWATWESSWTPFVEKYESSIEFRKAIQQKGMSEIIRFNAGGSYDYFGLFTEELKGNMQSWAIRWYAYVFSHNYRTVFPQYSLVQNIGFDGSGVHKVVIQDQKTLQTTGDNTFDTIHVSKQVDQMQTKQLYKNLAQEIGNNTLYKKFRLLVKTILRYRKK